MVTEKFTVSSPTVVLSKKSSTGPTERTPKPEYRIALATYLGVRWYGPIQFLMDFIEPIKQPTQATGENHGELVLVSRNINKPLIPDPSS